MRSHRAIFLALLASTFLFSPAAAEENEQKTVTGKEEQLTVCEGDEALLQCEPGMVIQVVRANYGRYTQMACIDLDDPDTLEDLENLQKTCHNPQSALILSNK